MVVIYKIFAFIMAIFMTAIPYLKSCPDSIKTKEENCLLNLTMISDVHIEKKEIFRKLFLKNCLRKVKNADAKIDGILVDGDLTNYADEPSLAEYYNIIKKSTVPVITVAGNHDIGHAGDRDVTDITREQAYENVIKYYNLNYENKIDKNYYSTYLNGYKFIVLGDEVINGGHWDAVTMSDEQLAFLDRELADGTKDGKPVFVCCHWAIKGINGEETIYEDSGIDPEEYNVKGILEKYKNVFYISGHMHAGFKSKEVDEKFGLSNAERINGVTYLNLPTFGIVNWYGYPWSGTGAQLEVYENKVVFRPRNYLTNKWFANCEYEFSIS